MKVASLREGRPSLNDIPGRLRWLADEIEAKRIETDSVLVLIHTGMIPDGYNFGECLTLAQRIAILELTKYGIIRDAAP